MAVAIIWSSFGTVAIYWDISCGTKTPRPPVVVIASQAFNVFIDPPYSIFSASVHSRLPISSMQCGAQQNSTLWVALTPL